MYRILSASKDTYLTNRYMAGSRSLDANVGMAASMDFFANKDEVFLSASVSGTIELTRGLIQFDYSELHALTSSILDITDSSFKCYVNMKDIYGGQTTPSNFTLRLIPVSMSWNEGRGQDVVSYRDIDAANFITASITSGVATLWHMSGAGESGSMGDTAIDIMVSGDIGSGLQDLTVTQNFARGDEDLLMDVSSLVSASIAGIIPNYGFRISFSETEEYDSVTRFVKRFGTRHCNNKDYRPKLIVKYDDTIRDSTGKPQFNVTQDLFVYNNIDGTYQNFTSGSSSITGSNCLMLNLIASRSVMVATSSWSSIHSASINYMSRSLSVITQSYTGSQLFINTISQSGVYSASVNLSTVTNSTLINFLSGATEQRFRAEWVSLTGSYTYAQTHLTFKKPEGYFSNVTQKNYVVNITNLKQTYIQREIVKLRVFVQDYNTEQVAHRYATDISSEILYNMKWRLRRAYTREIVIPFDDVGTLCSVDAEGMYFTIYMADLDEHEVYEISLLVRENGHDYYIEDAGWRFKVMPNE